VPLRTIRDQFGQPRDIMAVVRVIGPVLCTLLVGTPLVIRAAEAPPAGGAFSFQTSGPNTAITVGDWYSSTIPGAGAGYHYLTIVVPCGWPASTALHIDLFSPEMNRVAGALVQSEEPRGNYDSTEFELYGPGASVGPGYAQPAPGTGVPGTRTVFAPGAPGVPETWIRFATLDPAACGTYLLRSAVLAADPGNPAGEGDDDNGWRIRVGSDDDADPATAPPANADDPDGQPGTNDELVLGENRVTYQQSSAGVSCLTLYAYVPPGAADVTFNNFDMDGNTRLRYYGPSDVYDPTATLGGTAGTMSANGAWNNGTLARGGDTIADPEIGWWRVVTCISANNQFIQEAPGLMLHGSQPGSPALTMTKTDGATEAVTGTQVQYELTVENAPSATGAALDVVISDPVPAGATFVTCAVVAPASGSCGASGGTVTATLDGWIAAGASATVEITVEVDDGASGSLTNAATASYGDVLGNPYPTVTATDVDNIVAGPPPTPTPAALPSPSGPLTSPSPSGSPGPSPALPDVALPASSGEGTALLAVGAILLAGAAVIGATGRRQRGAARTRNLGPRGGAGA
jgi:uncharacterized repeat protein (TIGR01451 family)